MKLFAFLLLPVLALGQVTVGYHRVNQVLQRGNSGTYAQVVPFATVFVTSTATGTNATIYSDPLLTSPIASSTVTADGSGNYDYYIPLNYCVNEQVSAPNGGSYLTTNICLGGGSSFNPHSPGPIGDVTPGPINATSVVAGTAMLNLQAPAYVIGNTASLWFNGTIVDSGSTPFLAHSIQSNQTLDGGTAAGDAFASFDSIDILNLGGLAWNHYHSFQSRPQVSGSGTLPEVAGLTYQPTYNGSGIITNSNGLHMYDAGGTGTVTHQIGLLCEPLTRGGDNYCIYDNSNKNNFFSLGLQLGNNVYINMDGLGTITTVGDTQSKTISATGTPTAYPSGQSTTVTGSGIITQSAPGSPATMSLNSTGGIVTTGGPFIAGAASYATQFSMIPTGFRSDDFVASGMFYKTLNYNAVTTQSYNTGFSAYSTYNQTTGGYDMFLGTVSTTGGTSVSSFAHPLSLTPTTQVVTCAFGGTSTQYCGADRAWHTPASTDPPTSTSGDFVKYNDAVGTHADSGIAVTAVPQKVNTCGTTTICSNTGQASPRIVWGTVTLASGTAAVGGMTAWTSTTSFVCTPNDTTTAGGAKIANTSTTSITVTGGTSDVVNYVCVGN